MPDEQHTKIEVGYAAAAEQYWNHGWRGILPLRRGFKKTPPRNFTGAAGIEPSYADILSWAEEYPNGNLCLRLPDGVIGIDVDAYGAKTGAAALDEAQKRWGPLPEAPRTTSREDGISGIRLYRVPPGTRLAEGIDFTELGIGDIEIVQHHHRYALAWPSIHPEGGTYWWRNSRDQFLSIPSICDLPALSSTWIDALRVVNGTAPLDGAQYHTPEALTTGEPSSKVAARLRQAIKELNLPGQSRHDTARGHVLALLRLGKRSESGVDQALAALGEMFVALVAPDRPGGAEEARGEYRAMVTGPGAARELAKPSNTEWMVGIAVADITDQPEPVASPVDDGRPYSHLEDIERGFWDARDSLKAIYETALACMCSPWSVLAICAARALCLVPPRIQLPAVVGAGGGSLNSFFAIVARSSGGKGISGQVAAQLIPAHVNKREVGSGEGVVAMLNGDPKDPDSYLESVYFDIPEIDGLRAVSERTGASLMSVLRKAWSGESLGFGWADRTKRTHRDQHTYRLTVTMGIQPQRAQWLLADADGGTPQRFLWFPAHDNRIRAATANPKMWIGALTLPNTTDFQYPQTLQIPAEATELILATREANAREQVDALDGHGLFAREKFAYALTILDGRTEMTSEDWELSGIVADISTYTRELVLDSIKEATFRGAEDRGVLRGIEMETADVERGHRRSERTQRVLRWLLDKLDEAGDEGLGNRELHRKITSRDRQALSDALGAAVANGLIGQADDGKWVKK